MNGSNNRTDISEYMQTVTFHASESITWLSNNQLDLSSM